MFVYVSKLDKFKFSMIDLFQCPEDYISLTQITRMILIFRHPCRRAQIWE